MFSARANLRSSPPGNGLPSQEETRCGLDLDSTAFSANGLEHFPLARSVIDCHVSVETVQIPELRVRWHFLGGRCVFLFAANTQNLIRVYRIDTKIFKNLTRFLYGFQWSEVST